MLWCLLTHSTYQPFPPSSFCIHRACRYDPFCWGTPEGSYASDPDGPARILEARTMIQGLHAQGWRVVPDVVYNHGEPKQTLS